MTDKLRFVHRLIHQRVEIVLKLVRIYKQIGFVRKQTLQTISYQENIIHIDRNPTSSCATWNVDREEYLKTLSNNVDVAVSRLDDIEREIITRRYLMSELTMDYIIWPSLGVSERQYYRKKREAVCKLAYMLQLDSNVDDSYLAGILYNFGLNPAR